MLVGTFVSTGRARGRQASLSGNLLGPVWRNSEGFGLVSWSSQVPPASRLEECNPAASVLESRVGARLSVQ